MGAQYGLITGIICQIPNHLWKVMKMMKHENRLIQLLLSFSYLTQVSWSVVSIASMPGSSEDALHSVAYDELYNKWCLC